MLKAVLAVYAVPAFGVVALWLFRFRRRAARARADYDAALLGLECARVRRAAGDAREAAALVDRGRVRARILTGV